MQSPTTRVLCLLLVSLLCMATGSMAMPVGLEDEDVAQTTASVRPDYSTTVLDEQPSHPTYSIRGDYVNDPLEFQAILDRLRAEHEEEPSVPVYGSIRSDMANYLPEDAPLEAVLASIEEAIRREAGSERPNKRRSNLLDSSIEEDRLHEDDQDQNSIECAICLSGFLKSGGRNNLVYSCGHKFHRDCINGWLNEQRSTCPMCRSHLSEAQVFAGDD